MKRILTTLFFCVISITIVLAQNISTEDKNEIKLLADKCIEEYKRTADLRNDNDEIDIRVKKSFLRLFENKAFVANDLNLSQINNNIEVDYYANNISFEMSDLKGQMHTFSSEKQILVNEIKFDELDGNYEIPVKLKKTMHYGLDENLNVVEYKNGETIPLEFTVNVYLDTKIARIGGIRKDTDEAVAMNVTSNKDSGPVYKEDKKKEKKEKNRIEKEEKERQKQNEKDKERLAKLKKEQEERDKKELAAQKEREEKEEQAQLAKQQEEDRQKEEERLAELKKEQEEKQKELEELAKKQKQDERERLARVKEEQLKKEKEALLAEQAKKEEKLQQDRIARLAEEAAEKEAKLKAAREKDAELAKKLEEQRLAKLSREEQERIARENKEKQEAEEKAAKEEKAREEKLAQLKKEEEERKKKEDEEEAAEKEAKLKEAREKDAELAKKLEEERLAKLSREEQERIAKENKEKREAEEKAAKEEKAREEKLAQLKKEEEERKKKEDAEEAKSGNKTVAITTDPPTRRRNAHLYFGFGAIGALPLDNATIRSGYNFTYESNLSIGGGIKLLYSPQRAKHATVFLNIGAAFMPYSSEFNGLETFVFDNPGADNFGVSVSQKSAIVNLSESLSANTLQIPVGLSFQILKSDKTKLFIDLLAKPHFQIGTATHNVVGTIMYAAKYDEFGSVLELLGNFNPENEIVVENGYGIDFPMSFASEVTYNEPFAVGGGLNLLTNIGGKSYFGIYIHYNYYLTSPGWTLKDSNADVLNLIKDGNLIDESIDGMPFNIDKNNNYFSSFADSFIENIDLSAVEFGISYNIKIK